MNITVLGATGLTGRELVRQALARGHVVTAVARDPAKLDVEGVRRAAGDVRNPESMTHALAGTEVIVSALGVAKGERPGVLTAGARAVVASGAGRVVWLGAFGAGPSAAAAGRLTRTLLKAMGDRLSDKVTADAAILAAGGTVFHAGPLSLGPLGPGRRTVGLEDAPRRLFPARVSRATVAAAMLDEAESPRFAGRVAIPL
ncbi:NAD(P)H-binding protein [Actinoplanes sp. NPDC051411]|uniref:NAD(P)-dependent oxidoreductase n=1 Tax=Actinoplanes sp. NPDC051411 TaxID=3155522 RepID=UPI00343B5049